MIFTRSTTSKALLSLMRDQNADIVKLFGFFLYQPKHKVFAYWDLERDFPLHFRLSPANQPSAMSNNGQMPGRWGYGFSYVFHRKVCKQFNFPIKIMEKTRSLLTLRSTN
jgi:hypothetical protein